MAITQVRSKQQFLVTDNVSFQSAYRITNLVDPSAAQDAATKAYVDAVKTGLDFKDSARVATTGAETYTISGGAVTVITGTAIDGVSPSIGDRILIKNAPAASGAGAGAGTANTTQPANGIYKVDGNTTNLTVSRATDADVSAEVTAGMFVFVSEGTTNADNGYVLTTNDTVTLNTTGLTFTQFSGAGQITAGAALTKTGNTLDVAVDDVTIEVFSDALRIKSTYVGQTSITTLGTVATGTWNATTIATTRGGTGLTSYAQGDLIYASGANTLTTLTKSTTANQFLKNSGTSNNPAWATIAASDIGSGAALTKTDDTNVTLTLGGSPSTALLAATSITVGWSGSLAVGRGGTGATTLTGVLIGNGTSAVTAITGTANQLLRRNAGNTAYEFFTPTYLTSAVTTITFGTTGLTPSSATSGAVTVAGTLVAANGGTGLSSYAIGDLIYASATTTLAKLAAVAAGSYLRSAGTGTAPVWSTVTIPNAATLGDIWYGSAANTVIALTGNTTTTKQYLSQTGTGTVSAAPAWSAIAGADVTGAALTKTDDTNVTLTLGGTPTTALLRAASLTLGWTGTLAVSRGGTGAGTKTEAYDNLSPNSTLGDITYHNGTDNVRLAGNITTAKQFLSQTGTSTVSAAPSWATIAGSDITGAALTKTDDTNVTLTLGGTPTTALLRAASLTLGWSGTLAVDRGGSGRASATAYMPIVGGTTSTGAHQSVSVGTTTNQVLLYKGASALPAFGAVDLAGGANIITGTLPVGNGGTGQSSYTDGQLLIGNTSTGLLTKATLTAGSGITITNGNGSITIQASASGLGTGNFIVREVPSGTVDGSNATFTLTNTPSTVSNGAGAASSEQVYVNGVLQNVGGSNDYTISGATITFNTNAKPQSGDVILVSYMK
jgi:hypothetical protein